MFKKLRRELYLLSRGEQRALLVVTFLMILSFAVRVVIEVLPGREPSGIDKFEQEARMIMAMLATADSLEQHRADSLETKRTSSLRNVKSPVSRKTKEKSYSQIDLNRADSTQLLPLPGIGPVFAGRIVNYRDLLGGFVCADQLKEVYGMPPETVDRIRDRIYIDSAAVRKIRLNSATFGALLRHPYLEYEEVKALVEYRDFKNDISSAQELNANQILHDSTLNRIVGYFDFR